MRGTHPRLGIITIGVCLCRSSRTATSQLLWGCRDGKRDEREREEKKQDRRGGKGMNLHDYENENPFVVSVFCFIFRLQLFTLLFRHRNSWVEKLKSDNFGYT